MKTPKRNTIEDAFQRLIDLESDYRQSGEICVVLFADLSNSTLFKQERGIVLGIQRAYEHNQHVSAICEQRTGQFVKSLGDGVLIRFDSTTKYTDAVNSAIEIQRALGRRNKQLEDPLARLETRIGIAAGPVINLMGDDPHGPSVDLAARLQSLARPGQILISDELHARMDASNILPQTNGMPSPISGPFDVKLKGFPRSQRAWDISWDGTTRNIVATETFLEPWADYNYNATLFNLLDSPLSQKKFGITFDLKYRARLRHASLTFALADNWHQFHQALIDPHIFCVYMCPSVPTSNLKSIYDVSFVSVGGHELQQIGDAGRHGDLWTLTFQLSSDVDVEIGKIYQIHYRTSSVIAKRGNFFAMITEAPVRGLSMKFDFGAVKNQIRLVRAINCLAAETTPRFDYVPSIDNAQRIELHTDQLIPAGAGTVFVWDLLDEGDIE